MLTARFNLPAFGAKVTMPKTPSAMVSLESYDLPETVREDLIDCDISPVWRNKYHELLEGGSFTEAYEAWSKAAEDLLAFQLKNATLPIDV